MTDVKQLALLLALVVTGSASGDLLQSVINPPRPDPFRGSQARDLELRMTNKVEQLEARLQLELVQLELDIRRDMPPEPVRKRLRAIERKLEAMDPQWSPPTTDYYAPP